MSKGLDLTKVPFTNGIDNKIKGYVDLTDIVNDVVTDFEKEETARNENHARREENKRRNY